MKMSALFALILILWSGLGNAQPGAPATLDELLAQVRQTRTEEAQRNAARERRFLADKAAQQQRLEEARAALNAEQRRNEHLQQAFDTNEKNLTELQVKLHERSDTLLELFGIARQVAGEAKAIFRDSLVSTQIPGREEQLENLTQGQVLPAIRDLEALWFALQQEMTESGKVVNYRAPVIAADGGEHEQRVVRLGVFNATSGGRFLRYLPEIGRFQELPRQPARRYQRLAEALERAPSGMLPMAIDPSRGAVLGLLMQTPDLLERIQQGRLVGYIIIGIAVIGFLIGVERAFYLAVIGQRTKQQLKSDIPNRNNPLGRVMAVYQESRGVDTETLELKIDASILKDMPRLQRGLQALRVLAVIAPLLGLLGTVTGLIETFQSITLFGTGDPRLMAGGISQALITTMLGLTVAIPLLLLHSLLLSKSKRLLSLLEEQSAGIIAMHAERRNSYAAVA
jgi:biopolymer transport protein ExbB